MELDLATKIKHLGNTIGEFKDIKFTEDIGRDKIKNWVEQFPEADRTFVLDELAHIFETSLISEEKLTRFLENVAAELNVGDRMNSVTLIHVDSKSMSQLDMVNRLKKLCPEVTVNDYRKPEFLYLDDVLYTGFSLLKGVQTLQTDLGVGKIVSVKVYFQYMQAEYNIISLRKWLNDRSSSLNIDSKDNINCLYDGAFLAGSHFTSNENRIRLRTIFTNATQHLSLGAQFKSLGLKAYDLPNGFGSTVATYRNCPNNAPIALWWNVGGWCPLLNRFEPPYTGSIFGDEDDEDEEEEEVKPAAATSMISLKRKKPE